MFKDPIELDVESYSFNVGIGRHDEIIIGVRLETTDGEQYLIPMDAQAAHNVGTMLQAHVQAINSALTRSRARV